MVGTKWMRYSTSAILIGIAYAHDYHAHHEHVARDGVATLEGGVKGGLTNAQQRIDNMVNDIKTNKAPGKAIMANFITGLDGQIDNAGATLLAVIDPITGNLADIPGDFLLGPVFQSITDGVEVVVGNTIGGAMDVVLVPATKLLSGDVAKMAVVAGKANVKDAQAKLTKQSHQLDQNIAQAEKKHAQSNPKSPKHARNDAANSAAYTDGVKTGLTNAQQRIDELTNNLKSKGDRPAADAMVSFITGLDGQIDNIIGVVGEDLAPITGGLSEDATNQILGPTFQSVTDGAEVLIGNLAGGAVDAVLVPALHGLSGSIGKVGDIAGEYKLHDAQIKLQQQSKQLISLASKADKKKSGSRKGTRDVGYDAYKNGVANAQQRIDNVANDLRNNRHPGRSIMVNAITGLDGQIDNVIQATADALTPVTGGISEAVAGQILGPTFQSITDGVEVLIGNLAGGALDVALVPVMNSLSGTLAKSSIIAKEVSLDSDYEKLESQSRQLASLAAKAHKENAHSVFDRRDGVATLEGGIKGGLTNAQQRIDNMVNDIKTNKAPGKAIMANFITGLDGQIDNAGATLLAVIDPITGNLADIPGDFLLGPVFQSITDGVEVVVGNGVGSILDIALVPATKLLSGDVAKMAVVAGKFNVKDAEMKLSKQSGQLVSMTKKSEEQYQKSIGKKGNKQHQRRDADPVSQGFKDGMVNAQQRFDSITNDLKNNRNPGKAVLTNAITGLDGQIDNMLSVIGNTLAPVTGGISNAVVGEILGPTFQSLTDGVEVLIGNVAGGAVDAVLVPSMHLLSGNLAKVSNVAKQYNVANYADVFEKQGKKLTELTARPAKAGKHFRRANDRDQQDKSLEAAKLVTGSQKRLDALFGILQGSGDQPGSNAINEFLSKFNSEATKADGVVHEAMDIVGSSPNWDNAEAIISPVFVSGVNGAEVLLTKVGSNYDQSYTEGYRQLSANLESFSRSASKYHQDNFANALHTMAQKLLTFSNGSQRRRDATTDAKSILSSQSQDVSALVDKFKNNQEPVGQFITELDGQVDKIMKYSSDFIQQDSNPSDVQQTLSPVLSSVASGLDYLVSSIRKSPLQPEQVSSAHLLASNVINLSQIASHHRMEDIRQNLDDKATELSKLAAKQTLA